MAAWRESVGAALEVAQRAGAQAGPRAAAAVAGAAKSAFLDGLVVGCLVAGGVTLLGAIIVATFLPARPAVDSAAALDHLDDELAVLTAESA